MRNPGNWTGSPAAPRARRKGQDAQLYAGAQSPQIRSRCLPAIRSSTHLHDLGENYVLSALVSSAGKEIKSCILPVDSFQINVQSSIKHSLGVK